MYHYFHSSSELHFYLVLFLPPSRYHDCYSVNSQAQNKTLLLLTVTCIILCIFSKTSQPFSDYLKWQLLLYFDYQLSRAQCKFGDKVLALNLRCCHKQLTQFPLVTIQSCITYCVTYNFACFATDDFKDKQDATGSEASCSWQQHNFHVETWWPNFFAPYSTDNHRNIASSVEI